MQHAVQRKYAIATDGPLRCVLYSGAVDLDLQCVSLWRSSRIVHEQCTQSARWRPMHTGDRNMLDWYSVTISVSTATGRCSCYWCTHTCPALPLVHGSALCCCIAAAYCMQIWVVHSACGVQRRHGPHTNQTHRVMHHTTTKTSQPHRVADNAASKCARMPPPHSSTGGK
jgi:hypothetical protein